MEKKDGDDNTNTVLNNYHRVADLRQPSPTSASQSASEKGKGLPDRAPHDTISFTERLESMKAAAFARHHRQDTVHGRQLDGHKTSTTATATSSSPYATLGTNHRTSQPTPELINEYLSGDKMKSILSYLDEVERENDRDRGQDQDLLLGLGERDNVDESATVMDEMNEKAVEAAADVRAGILNQQILLAEKEQAIGALRGALDQKDSAVKGALKNKDVESRRQVKEHEAAMARQKTEYEAVIKRHLTFIDTLISDKKTLGDRVEILVANLKSLDKKCTHKVKALRERNSLELKQQKELLLKAEKSRREKWITERTRQIKEATVKGLEPEIQKILAKHKKDISTLRELHEEELQRLGGDNSARYHNDVSQIKEAAEEEKQKAISQEREAARQRYQRELESVEETYQQQRRRLLQDVQEERASNARILGEERTRMEQELKEMREADSKTTSALREDCDKLIEEATRRHKAEIKNMKEQLAIEKESWETMFMRRQDASLAEKEEAIREKVRAERDRDIEMVITRLEEEASTAQAELERQAESRIQKVRDRLEAQVRDAESNETRSQAQCRDLKLENAKLSSEKAELQAELENLKRQVDSARTTVVKLNQEREDLTHVVRREFEEQLKADEKDIANLRREIAELRSRHRKELSDAERAKDEELDNVNRRVRQIISGKEETIAELRKQFKSAAVRADHLETILEQLRGAGKR